MKIQINKQFSTALHYLENTNNNIFITGKAGTGKSTLLQYFCQYTKKKVVVLAPTGVAALNIGGQTIHKFFNFYMDITIDKILDKVFTPKNKNLYKKIDTIIIDEVSMLRADLLDCINAVLYLYGPNPGQAFGGIQMIFIGDLYQLPPVIGRDELGLFKQLYTSPYFFSAKSIAARHLQLLELTKVYRQTDTLFINLLNKIRDNTVEAADLDAINQQCLGQETATTLQGAGISLTSTNLIANNINKEHLDALDTKLYTREAVIEGDFAKEYYPTELNLQFKPGAQIMFLNNDSMGRWVNGSLGIIESIKDEHGADECLVVKLIDSRCRLDVAPYKWEVYKFVSSGDKLASKVVGSFTQYPIRLAWAVTIHKSQGKSFDKIVIDMGKGAFATGQFYVAMSRCRTLQGIQLRSKAKKSDIRVDPAVSDFMRVMSSRDLVEH